MYLENTNNGIAKVSLGAALQGLRLKSPANQDCLGPNVRVQPGSTVFLSQHSVVSPRRRHELQYEATV